MVHKILVPLDGSCQAEKVLTHVAHLARCMDAELVLLRVPVYAYAQEAYASYALGQGYRPVPLAPDHAEVLAESKKYMHKLANELCRLGLRVSVVIPDGETVARICEYANESQVDLIAMATHAPGGLHRMIFGSVVDEVLRQSGKPVLLVRTGE